MDLSLLNSIIQSCSVCNHHKVGMLKLVKEKKNGMAKKLLLKCCSCDQENVFYTSKMNGKMTKKSQGLSPFDVNTRFLIAMRMLGKDFEGLQVFSGVMNMISPMKQNAYMNLLHKKKMLWIM